MNTVKYITLSLSIMIGWLSMSAADEITVNSVNAEVVVNNKVTKVFTGDKFIVESVPSIAGDAPRIQFTLMNPTTQKGDAMFWAKRGKGTYYYTYATLDNKRYRSLRIYSSEFNLGVTINVPYNFDGSGFIAFVYWNNENGKRTQTKSIGFNVTAQDGKNIFYFIAQTIKRLNFGKSQSDSLNLDI